MKSNRQLLIALLVGMTLSFLCGAITERYKIFPFNQAAARANPGTNYSDYFYDKKSFFEQHGGHRYDVVFIGDSITDAADWEELFPMLKIANRGVYGDRTDGVLKRMDSIYSTNAKKAFIMIGINDFIHGAEVNDVAENYTRIVGDLVAHGVQTYAQSTLLAGSSRAELNEKIAALNNRLKKMADENKSFTYIDLNAGLASGSVLDAKYTRDDIHLNGEGYGVWKGIIARYIQ